MQERSEQTFDFAKRSEERAREGQPETSLLAPKQRVDDARALKSAIDKFYGKNFPGQFEAAVDGSVVTVTKKPGTSVLKIEVLGEDKFKLSGGSGPGGFSTDRASLEDDVTGAMMMDELEDWFHISN